MPRVMRLAAVDWADVVNRAQAAARGDASSAGDPDPLVAAVAQHLTAPVRASVVATAGKVGTMTRVTLVADRALLVTQPIAERAGTLRPADQVEVVFATPDEIWPALAARLPTLDALRTSRIAARSSSKRPILEGEPAVELLAHEQANAQVTVEAWRRTDGPAVVWARLWSVIDGRLYDVRSDDGQIRMAEREAGSVASEWQWALVGALDATTGAAEDASM